MRNIYIWLAANIAAMIGMLFSELLDLAIVNLVYHSRTRPCTAATLLYLPIAHQESLRPL